MKTIEYSAKESGFSPLRVSSDGVILSDFHRHCDDKGPTLCLIAVSSNKGVSIFGGYTTQSWRRTWTSENYNQAGIEYLRSYESL